MSSHRPRAASAVAVFLTVAVSLLGVRLFLPGTPGACAPAESACCCGSEAPADDGCGCTVSQATPVPAAVLAPVDGLAAPELAAAQALIATNGVPCAGRRASWPSPRARSAPTQALLETFRN